MTTNQHDISKGHADPRIPGRDQCVLRYIMDKWDREQPDKTYAIFDDGTEWNYREIRERTISMAVGLQKLGVKQGDHVVVWLPTNAESLIVFFAINYIGAVYVPINTAFKGQILEHVLDVSDAKVIIAQASLVERLVDIDLAGLKKLVVAGQAPEIGPDLITSDFSGLKASAEELQPLSRPIEPWDTQSIIFTSGTTGPSKGVLSSYLHMYTNPGPEAWPFVIPEDRYLINMPMFHIGGMGLVFCMLVRGGSISFMGEFSTEKFWPFVRETETTVVFLLGVMASFLFKMPPSESDRDHSLRLVMMVPYPDIAKDFSDRFGVDIYTIFNMTEIASPIVSEANPAARGTCGKVRPGVEVRLVDHNDCEVPKGQIGEMIVRADCPWTMNSGYYKNPEATAEAWRNGWFHTGDAFKQDEEDNFYFVDRVKDAIRRRGENISSFEVESIVATFPAIKEVAAIAVPSEQGEDEVMIVVAPVSGQQIDPVELLEFLKSRMPYFMIPRYVRFIDTLPMTPSQKVKKTELRVEGITSDCWDREEAGIVIKRERIS
jgi:crotonobetaine/carnitine-CoA ligase